MIVGKEVYIEPNMKTDRIFKRRFDPILKWTGGKGQELKYIHPLLPNNINNYYEPFVGGGAVYFSIASNRYFVNDKSSELINLYRAIKEQDQIFFQTINEIIYNWRLLEEIINRNALFFIELYLSFSNNEINEVGLKNKIIEFVIKHSKEFNGMLEINFNVCINNFLKEIDKNIINKAKRMKKIEAKKGKLSDKDIVDNIEGALKSSFYMHFRHLYNNIKTYNINVSKEAAIFFFIRNFAYSGMFRYNKSGEFNVPYGGIGYNRKNIAKKIESFQRNDLFNHLKKTTIESLDFESFFDKHEPLENDFVFLDPPYDSDFSTYAKNIFNKNDQKRLASYLISHCKSKWLMVIKNTDFISSLYDNPKLNITHFDKKYLVNFQNRNDKNAEHLIIRNYAV